MWLFIPYKILIHNLKVNVVSRLKSFFFIKTLVQKLCTMSIHIFTLEATYINSHSCKENDTQKFYSYACTIQEWVLIVGLQAKYVESLRFKLPPLVKTLNLNKIIYKLVNNKYENLC